MVAAGLDQDTLDMVLESIGMFAEGRLSDSVLLELDHEDRFPEEIVRGMCGDELGVSLLFIPEEYGGMGGGSFDVYRVCEQMAAVDLGIATGVLATFLGSDPIVFGGTEEQQARWLGAIAEEGLQMAYGATEPEAGSDLASMKTIAERIEEDGEIVGYKISGNKQWISNGGYADLYTILALAPDGPSWFVVDRGTPGFDHGKPEDKHGIRASNTAALSLMDVEVTPDRLVGGAEGLGLQQAQAVFGYTRLMVAAFGLGAGWAALDRAIEYSTGRVQAGSPLSEKRGYTHKLIVPHAARLEGARAYIEQTAAALDALDEPEGHLITEGAIAKYLATEAGNRAADAAIQALGGYGYTREYLVEKIKRDVRITTIYEGTSEIMEMSVSRDRWQLHLKTRGQHYLDEARELATLADDHPGCGADAAALALRALGRALERCRTARLTRHQHVLFRLGEMICWGEGAAAAARRAAALQRGEQPEKGDRRFPADAFATLARIFAREAALEVATGAMRWVRGADGVADPDLSAFAKEIGLEDIHAAQAGLVADMDRVTDALYERA